MHPVAREVAGAERALGLGDLVFVVGEDQVGAAAVDVEPLAEVAVRHRRALDVPAGAAVAPRARPERLAGLRPLPQREVERALLLLVHLDARARLEIVGALARELAVTGEARHRIVDVAAGGVGEALLLQPANDVDHLGDVLGRARLEIGRREAERAEVDLHLLGVLARHRVGRSALPRSPC